VTTSLRKSQHFYFRKTKGIGKVKNLSIRKKSLKNLGALNTPRFGGLMMD
jgi:hypothetical protein